MNSQTDDRLKSHILSQLAANIQGAKPDVTLVWREMACCALLDVWDVLYRRSSEPAWRDLWLLESKQVGNSNYSFLAADDLTDMDLLTKDEKTEAIEFIMDSIFQVRKGVMQSRPIEPRRKTDNFVLKGIGAVEILTAKAFHDPWEFPSADQFEEYLRYLTEIHGFLLHGDEGRNLVCELYFKIVRDRKSSIPPAWRRLHHVMSKDEYWKRFEERKRRIGSTCWRVDRFVSAMTKILLSKGIPVA